MEVAKDELRKLEIQKAAVHADIEKYGQDLERIQNDIQKSGDLTLEIEKLTEEVKNLSISRNDLVAAQKEVDDLTTTRTNLLSEIEACQENLDSMQDKKTEMSSLETKIVELYENLKQVVDKNDLATSYLAELEKEKMTKTIELQDLDKKLEEKKQLCDKIFFSYKETREGSLKELEDKITNRNEVLATTYIKISEAQTILSTMNDSVPVIQKNIQDLEATYEVKRSEKEVELVKLGADLTQKEIALNEREGNISLQETAQETKRNRLRAIKVNLEKEIGKSINIEI